MVRADVSAMPEVLITGFDTVDVRFPTSLRLDGSDAMNPAPDYSAAYVILRTNDPNLEGHGFCFTIGRGTEICVQAIRALAPVVVGEKAEDLFADMGGLWRRLVGDSQLRWLGPEKGVIHLATAAVVNAVWDLYAKTRGKPLWKLLADLDPEEIVALVDFRYLSDALTPDEALELLRVRAGGRAEREAHLAAAGYPAYDTSPGWLGYDDDKLRRRCREAVTAGFTHVKVKVGASIEDDLRRLRVAREVLGPDRGLLLDANQVWSVPEAIAWMGELAPFEPWCAQPGDVQAVPAGRRGRCLPGGRLPPRRGQRGRGGAAACGQVRRPSLPARWWRRPLRAGRASVGVRLRGGERLARGAHDRVRRPPAPALRRAGTGHQRSLPAATLPRLRSHDPASA